MAFDEASYVQDFIKKLRGARSLPRRPDGALRDHPARHRRGDRCAGQGGPRVLEQDLPGQAAAAQVARMCRAEDERLRLEHGTAMETRAWWQKRQSERQSAAEESITPGRRTAPGVRPARRGNQRHRRQVRCPSSAWAGPQAAQAVQRAGLTMVSGVTAARRRTDRQLHGPAQEHVGMRRGLGARTGASRCRAVPARRTLRLRRPIRPSGSMRWPSSAERGGRQAGISATEDARRSALKILRRAVKDGVDLRDVALYHLVTVARRRGHARCEHGAACAAEGRSWSGRTPR